MSEQLMRKRVVRALSSLDAIPVENPAQPGTPDVNYKGGWLELKWVRRWPGNPAAHLRIEHFTPQQRIWLERRWRAGGDAFMLLQVSNAREWLLLHGDAAAEHAGRATRDELIELSCAFFRHGLDVPKLLELLQDAVHHAGDL